MRILILDSSRHGNVADQESNRLLVECAAWLGHCARVLDADTVRFASSGEVLDPIGRDEVVLPRADLRSAADVHRFATVLGALQRHGCRILITPEALWNAEDKLRAHQLLEAAGIATLPTLVPPAGAATAAELEPLVQRLGGYPVVAKHAFGWGGMGVVQAADGDALAGVVSLVQQLAPQTRLLLQPYVRHRRTITVQVVDGAAVAAFASFADGGEFRTNRTGRTAALEPRGEAANLAVRALQALGLALGSVDLLENEQGTLQVLEVNEAPGLEALAPGDRRCAEAMVRLAAGGRAARRRVLLVVPFPLHHGRGNAVSAERLVAALRRADVDVLVLEVELARRVGWRATLGGFVPDVVHAIHAFRAGPLAAEIAAGLGVGLVVSFRGTDVGRGLGDPELRATTVRSARAAAWLTSLTEEQRAAIVADLPEVRDRISVVPHGVAMQPGARRFRAELRAEGSPLVVQLAAVRAIKGFPGVLDLVDRMHAARADLRYVLAGGLLEPELEEPLSQWFARRPWARWVGELSHADAVALLSEADLSLHASTEEGLSNALLESLALGVPAVARAIPATRTVLGAQQGGLLFETDDEAVAAALRVLAEPRLAHSLRAAGPLRVAESFPASAEVEGYLQAYRRALLARAPRDGR